MRTPACSDSKRSMVFPRRMVERSFNHPLISAKENIIAEHTVEWLAVQADGPPGEENRKLKRYKTINASYSAALSLEVQMLMKYFASFDSHLGAEIDIAYHTRYFPAFSLKFTGFNGIFNPTLNYKNSSIKYKFGHNFQTPSELMLGATYVVDADKNKRSLVWTG
ncbi:hypothetical protein NC651_025179 [Populus alba x Populus x berolinensis]|nr:hypothetical protein NC651_025179 [Populus alba x Populus x berolinensis]